MRRFRGQKFRFKTRNNEKTSSNSSERNTVTRCVSCRSAAHRTHLTAIRWNFAVAPTSDGQARSVHFGSSKKRRSRPERGASKQSLVTQHARGRKRKVHVNRR